MRCRGEPRTLERMFETRCPECKTTVAFGELPGDATCTACGLRLYVTDNQARWSAAYVAAAVTGDFSAPASDAWYTSPARAETVHRVDTVTIEQRRFNRRWQL